MAAMPRHGALAALLALSSACAAPRPLEPTDLRHGLLIARARVRGALVPFTSDVPDRASVEQLDAYGEPVPGKEAASSAAGEGGIYFLDLPAGRYALTGLSFPARGVRYEVALSSATMRKEAVDLGAGGVAFFGTLALDGRFPDFDVAVERALDVAGRWLAPFLPWAPLPRDADLRAVDRSIAEEKLALLAARRSLAGTLWAGRIEERLRAIGAAEPAARRGVLFDREIPLREEPFFSWRDTLRWGEPVRAPNGLAWRRPGGDARVVVFFTSATAPGFVGYDEAVRELRAAAGALSDPAAVYEVRVGTRAALAARVTDYRYPAGTLAGSEVRVTVTETALVDDPHGMFTARLRAPRAEFEQQLPAYRAFLLQLSLGPPQKAAAKPEPALPF